MIIEVIRMCVDITMYLLEWMSCSSGAQVALAGSNVAVQRGVVASPIIDMGI